MDSQEKKIRELSHKVCCLEDELKLYKSLAKFGEIYVRVSSRDCDGVYSYSNSTFKSIEEHDQAYENWVEWLEGPASWEIVSKEDLFSEEECGTFGQGWGIN